MSWDKLTKRQRNECRRLLEELRATGVSESVSQVAKFYDDVLDWKDGDITLTQLCERTGWDTPEAAHPEPSQDAPAPAPAETATPRPTAEPAITRVKQRATRVKKIREELRAEVAALRADITDADAEGTGRNEIVRSADGGLSKAKVFEHLGYTDIRTATEQALKAATLPDRIVVNLFERPAGQLNIRIEEEPDLAAMGSYDEEPEDGYDRSSREFSGWISRHNLISDLHHDLLKRGLRLFIEAEPDVVTALANGETAEIVKKAGA